MIERQVSIDSAWTWLLWLVVGLLECMGWGLTIAGHWKIGSMFSFTGCALSAYAAVRHVRCYMVRLASLIRAVAPADAPDHPGISSLHRIQ